MVALIADPPLSYGIELGDDYKVKRNRLGDGYSQRAAEGINHICQRWRLVWESVSDVQAEAIKDFFRGQGGVSNFTWTPPGQSSPIKLISIGRVRKRHNGFNNVDVSLDTEQVFDA